MASATRVTPQHSGLNSPLHLIAGIVDFLVKLGCSGQMSKIHPNLSIPELIKFIKHSFRESEFDEVQNTLMDREKIMQVKMENLVTDCALLKKKIDLLENTQSFSVLEKCCAEEKLDRTQRRCEELDKETVQMGETIKILRCEKLGCEEKLENSHRKCEEMEQRLVIMGKEIKDMRRDKIDATQAMNELKRKEIEADRVVEELQLKNVEANQTIIELRVKRMESDKAAEVYGSSLNNLDPRILKLETNLAKMLSVNMEVLPHLVHGTSNLAAAAIWQQFGSSKSMKKLLPDPAQFKAKLGSKLKRKSLSFPAASSTSKKQKDESAKESPGRGSNPAKSITPLSETTAPPSPRASKPLESALPDLPTSEVPPAPQSKGKEVALEPFEAREHFEAPRAEFPRAREFAHKIHEALLDVPLADEVDSASRSTNLLRYQAEVMYKQFALTEDLLTEKRSWLKKKEELSSRIEKSELVKMRVLEERDRLQTALLKRGTELEEAINQHIDAKVKYDAFRSSSALTEAKLLTEVASLQSQVAEQRNINIEILEDNRELRKEKADKGKVDWEVATEMSEFEPVREVLFAMAMKSAKDAVLARFPDLDLSFLETEEEEVEETTSEAAELGPDGKRTTGDGVWTSKAAEVIPEVEKRIEGEPKKEVEGVATGGDRAEGPEKTAENTRDVNEKLVFER